MVAIMVSHDVKVKLKKVNSYSALLCPVSKHCDMARVLQGDHTVLPATHTHEPYLPVPPSRKVSLPFGWYSLRLPTKGWPGWVDLAGLLHTKMNVHHRKLNADTVTHLSTNRAQCRLTSLIETGVLPLCQWCRISLTGIRVDVVEKAYNKL